MEPSGRGWGSSAISITRIRLPLGYCSRMNSSHSLGTSRTSHSSHRYVLLGRCLFQLLPDSLRCIGNGRVIPETLQPAVVLKELLFSITKSNQIHCGDAIRGDAQPFLRPVAVLVELYRPIQCQSPVDLLLRSVAVSHHEPGIGVRLAGVRSIPQGLLSGLSETIVAGAAGVLLAGNIQQNVVFRFFHRWIVCPGLVP